MSTVLVTGCAGFIGSQIAEACIARGDRVIGVDSFTDYYDVEQKRSNVAALTAAPRFELVERDVAECVGELLDGVDLVFHQAGQPGVRGSWREQFDEYIERNIRVTQRVLEAALRHRLPRLVYASSSSVYGNADRYPVDESMLPRPHSPYGVTKLAAEHLVNLYASNFGLSTVSLRYFTVYGPRQRPDMATHRLFEAALRGGAFPLFGSGEQARDFTYVGDVVAANLLAGAADVPAGLTVNIAGGGQCTMLELIAQVEEISGRTVDVRRLDSEHGDVGRTDALTERAAQTLGWTPVVDLPSGLRHQHEWHRSR